MDGAHDDGSAQTESEFKLRARAPVAIAAVDAALRELGAATASFASRVHRDTYLDDDRQSLQRAGIGLRLRVSGDARQLTCKARGREHDRLLVRDELEVSWPSATPPATAHELPPSLRDAVQPFVLDRRLCPRQQLEVRREIRRIGGAQGDVCELAIDEVVAAADGRTATFQEVELEVRNDVDGSRRLATGLHERLPLEFTGQDKPSHAAALLGIEAPRRADVDPALAPCADVVRQQLHDGLAAMRALEVDVRRDDDAEHVHRMRICIRRMRSLLRAFRELWPAHVADRIDEGLRETGRRLGAVRDLDVMLERLPQQAEQLPPELRPAVTGLLDWIGSLRAASHGDLREWLRSPDRLRDMRTLEADLDTLRDDGELARTEMCRAAPPQLGAAVARLRKRASAIADELPIDAAHRLRLAAKRVRYLADAFAHLPDMDYGKAHKAVTRVQQRFGVVCDHEVASERLLGWVRRAAEHSDDGARTAAVLGALAAIHHAAAQKARARALRALRKLDHKRVWRRLPRA